MYEILVSSSEKFRARPNTGTIAAGATDLIQIHLLSGSIVYDLEKNIFF